MAFPFQISRYATDNIITYDVIKLLLPLNKACPPVNESGFTTGLVVWWLTSVVLHPWALDHSLHEKFNKQNSNLGVLKSNIVGQNKIN